MSYRILEKPEGVFNVQEERLKSCEGFFDLPTSMRHYWETIKSFNNLDEAREFKRKFILNNEGIIWE